MSETTQAVTKAEPKLVPFGMANITLEDDKGNKIYFRGKNTDEGNEYLQVSGGTLTLDPDFEEIKFEDFGKSPYDHYLVGYKGKLKIVAGQEDITMLKLAIAGATDITDTGKGVTGVTDGPLGMSNRKRAYRINIHPRFLPESDKSKDITIYKAASTSGYTRPYGNSQGKVEIELAAYPRDNADATVGANFFFTGEIDPNKKEEKGQVQPQATSQPSGEQESGSSSEQNQ